MTYGTGGKLTPQLIKRFVFSFQAQEVITTIRREDESKRKELKRIFEETLKTLESLDDHVINHMISEGTISDLRGDLEKYISNLESNECPILVAGK